MQGRNRRHSTSAIFATVLLFAVLVSHAKAQQKDMPEVTIATAVSNMAFSALWVAEQLKYFEQEGVRVKITSAGGGSPCHSAVVGRSVNFCASTSPKIWRMFRPSAARTNPVPSRSLAPSTGCAR